MYPTEEDFAHTCLVCGKSVDHGGGLAQIEVDGRMIALCCPLCFGVYQKNPEKFLAKLPLRPPGG